MSQSFVGQQVFTYRLGQEQLLKYSYVNTLLILGNICTYEVSVRGMFQDQIVAVFCFSFKVFKNLKH